MKVAVDAMGGDHGPEVVVEGAVNAAREHGIEVILVGQEAVLQALLRRYHVGSLPVFIKHASQVVGMDESPADSLRRKKDSTIKVAFELLASGQVNSVVSAGNSGATLATAMVTIGRINNVRPAIATLIPTLKQPAIMIDVGANVDCKPVHLLQFGLMGAVFAQVRLQKTSPRVGLLSIGEEDSKGNQQVKKAYDLLASSRMNFVGNVEGREVFKGDVDVIVCDGFVGNICLKLSEGLAESMIEMMKKEMNVSLAAKTGYLLAKTALHRFKKRVDYAEYGGAPLLGVSGVVIICHGRSGAKAMKNAICVANDMAQADIISKLKAALELQEDAGRQLCAQGL